MIYMKHIDGKIASQGIGIGRLYNYLPIKALLQIYKSFIRPYLDYCDVIYHKPTYDDFSSTYYSERARTDPVNINYQITNRIEAVQYNAAPAVTGCIRGTSREKLSCELGLTSLYDRTSLFLNQHTPQYLRDFIPDSFRILKLGVQIVMML